MATQPTAQDHETNEAIYVKDGLMTWEMFQQALLLISLPLTGALLAFLLVLLVTPQLKDYKRMIPHYQYTYEKNVKHCEKLWQQQNLAEFKTCIQKLEFRIIEFTERYEEIDYSEDEDLGSNLVKIGNLDAELFTRLKQKLNEALAIGKIPETIINEQKVAVNEVYDGTIGVVSDGMANGGMANAGMANGDATNIGAIDSEGIDIYGMTDISEILKWCTVLKSRSFINININNSNIRAIECYRRVLELDPQNYGARRAIRQIKAKYTQWAMRALTSAENGKGFLDRSLERAKTNIDRVKAIDPDDEILADLIKRYERLEKQHKAQLKEECYDIIELAAPSGDDITESERIFIRQNCPQEAINKLDMLIKEDTVPPLFETEE